MRPEMRQKIIRGLNTAWLEAGPRDAPILLLLHGFPDAPESWEHQIAGFSTDYCVVAPYMRGAGPSTPASELRRYGPDAVALDLLAILDEVDPTRERPVYVVGHDLGAVHAWHIAALLQSRAARLVIINGLTIGQMARRYGDLRQWARSWYIVAMQMPRLPELLARRFPRRVVDLAHRLGGLPPEQAPPLAAIKDALVGPLNQYRAFLREVPRRTRGRTPRPACPVLVLWGAEDGFVIPPTRSELARDAADLTVRILEGNHWLQREQPERVNRLLGDFFGRAEPRCEGATP